MSTIYSMYGNTLDAWAELKEVFTYFSQDPRNGDGYTNRSAEVNKVGVVQNLASGVVDSNGHLVNTDNRMLWIDEELTTGWFIRRQGVVYRIMVDNDWNQEMGFFSYSLERVIGANGDTQTEPPWNTGEGSLG